MIVVKVGGSLFDWPELPARLRVWLAGLDATEVLLIPGGGATADAIRTLDRTFELGEDASHWLAIQALSLNARFLQSILPGTILEPDERARDNQASLAGASGSDNVMAILDAYPFFRADERRAEHLPHRWDVTSDSLAVRAAVLLGATDLILLKSASWAGSDWTAASEAGLVDPYFPQALRQAPTQLGVRLVNLRDAAV